MSLNINFLMNKSAEKHLISFDKVIILSAYSKSYLNKDNIIKPLEVNIII